MSSENIVQTVDVDATISVQERDVPAPLENPAVVEAEIERVFGGGGSQAEVTVIFDGFLSAEEKDLIDSFAQSGPRDDNFIEYDDPATRRANQMEIAVDVTTTIFFQDEIREDTSRLFSGTVIKVTESNERTVTFEALDRRHELNRVMVQLDIAEPTPVEDVVQRVIDNKNNTGLQLDPSQYNIEPTVVQSTDTRDFTLSTLDPMETGVLVNNLSYGVDAHATAYEVLQDLARKAGATIHIDEENVLHFTTFPEHKRFDGRSMPPIVSWESGDDETENDIIIESPYDETGFGIYATTAREVTGDRDGEVPASEVTKEMNVFDRNAVSNAREFELLSNELMKNSGTIRCVGDPEIEPYDMFDIDDSVIDGFAPISEGSYMATTVRHIINQDDGYLVELELGNDPDELFEQFTNQSVNSFDAAQAAAEAEEDAADGSFFDYIPFIGD